MNIRPLHDRLIIQRVEEEQVGSIVIPDSSEKPTRGKVVATGPGKIMDNGDIMPLAVAAGDLVLIGKYSGTEVQVNGEDYVVMREDDVMAVVE